MFCILFFLLWGWTVNPLYSLLSSATSSLRFISCSIHFLYVCLCPPPGLPLAINTTLSCSILLTWPNHHSLLCLNMTSIFLVPHLLATSSLVTILPCTSSLSSQILSGPSSVCQWEPTFRPHTSWLILSMPPTLLLCFSKVHWFTSSPDISPLWLCCCHSPPHCSVHLCLSQLYTQSNSIASPPPPPCPVHPVVNGCQALIGLCVLSPGIFSLLLQFLPVLSLCGIWPKMLCRPNETFQLYE